jgi:hypothetical protein
LVTSFILFPPLFPILAKDSPILNTPFFNSILPFSSGPHSDMNHRIYILKRV